jgi:hypothetical protein
MSEDYLWNKTGGDAEIEKLENALKAFRFRETAPPAIPAETFVLEKKPARKFFDFRFAFAFASGAAAILILLGVWFQFTNDRTANLDTLSAANPPTPINSEIPRDAAESNPENQIAEPIRQSPQTFKRSVVKTRRTVPANFKHSRAVSKNNKIKDSTVALTKEEKYAYEQLMLALSITGSKLKIVRDKANNIEEQNAALETQR